MIVDRVARRIRRMRRRRRAGTMPRTDAERRRAWASRWSAVGDSRPSFAWYRTDLPDELMDERAAGKVGLDIGCGDGVLSEALMREGRFEVGIAIDVAESAVRRLRGSQVSGVVGDATKLPFRTGSIDFAFDRGCGHFLSPTAQRTLLDEVGRVLAPGRQFLLSYRDHAPFDLASSLPSTLAVEQSRAEGERLIAWCRRTA